MNVETWERAVADALASANEDVLVNGVTGADALASVLDQPTYDANRVLSEEGMRRLAYAIVRATASTPAQWSNLPMLGAWYAGNDGRPAPAWRVLLDGRVQLRGRAAGGSAGVVCGPLPLGKRPAVDRHFLVPALGGSQTARVIVRIDGTVTLESFGTGAGSWVELEQVVFDLQ